MKKKVIATIGIVALIVTMSRCDTSEVTAYNQSRLYSPESEFFDPSGTIIVDRQTGVEYWYIPGAGQMPAVVTVLLDADGKPVIYKGE